MITIISMDTSAKQNSGFALIELMVVIGILGVLLAITLVAINPAKQFQQANNTKRRSDTNAIISAVGQYIVENKGQLPAAITTSVQTISNTASNLCSLLVPTYIAALPVDPLTNNGNAVTNCGAAYTTNYTIVKNSTGRITVAAPAAQNGETISVNQ